MTHSTTPLPPTARWSAHLDLKRAQKQALRQAAAQLVSWQPSTPRRDGAHSTREVA